LGRFGGPRAECRSNTRRECRLTARGCVEEVEEVEEEGSSAVEDSVEFDDVDGLEVAIEDASVEGERKVRNDARRRVDEGFFWRVVAEVLGGGTDAVGQATGDRGLGGDSVAPTDEEEKERMRKEARRPPPCGLDGESFAVSELSELRCLMGLRGGGPGDFFLAARWGPRVAERELRLSRVSGVGGVGVGASSDERFGLATSAFFAVTTGDGRFAREANVPANTDFLVVVVAVAVALIVVPLVL
jgi:hypothetical protein